MALVRKLYDDPDVINYFGEAIETFREEWEFEVDGIKYVHPYKRNINGQANQIVRPMFELKYDDGT
jgi:hypothetical protein